MTPGFTDPAALQRWNSYFAEVSRLLRRAGADGTSLSDDLQAHVIDSMAATPDGGELERLDAALSRLGRPIDYLRPLIADELIGQATRTYSPITLGRGLFHAALSGSRRMAVALAFGLGYLLLGIFTAMAVLKPLWGDHVGLFRLADGRVSAGILARTDGARDLLGWWSIPIALLLAALLYVSLTRGLGVLRPRR